MREFFKPWRRKIGVLTLGLACAFAAGWVRSGYNFDQFFRDRSDVAYIFTSGCGVLSFELRQRGGDRDEPEMEFTTWPIRSGGMYDPFGTVTPTWRWDWAGFHCGSQDFGEGITSDIFAIPHWSIVLPLTLLSAWLLLSKQPPTKVKDQP